MELQTVRSFRVPPSGGYVTKMPLCRHGLYTSAWRGGKLFFSHFNLPSFFGRFCCSSKNKGSRCEDGWSVETAQSNVSSNVEIIVDIKERGKCQLSLRKAAKRIERGNNAIKKSGTGGGKISLKTIMVTTDWPKCRRTGRSSTNMALWSLPSECSLSSFFWVMNECKRFLQNLVATLLIKRSAQDVKGERKGYR